MRVRQTAILVDGSNLYASCKALHMSVDYKKILTYFEGPVFRALYFTALPDKDEDSTLRPMTDWMAYNGWIIKQKPIKRFIDPATGLEKIKGNMDVEMAVEAMKLAPHVTDMVFFSGDGDFRSVVEAVQEAGVRVRVVSTIQSEPPMIADELRRQCDVFEDLGDMKRSLRRGEATPVERRAELEAEVAPRPPGSSFLVRRKAP